jgi:hypothetical protein
VHLLQLLMTLMLLLPPPPPSPQCQTLPPHLSLHVSMILWVQLHAEAMSVNGSFAVGQWSNVTANNGAGRTLSKCNIPTSVLFDNSISTLMITELDRDMWASQLLTLQTTVFNRREVIMDFTSMPNYEAVWTIKMVMVHDCIWGCTGGRTYWDHRTVHNQVHNKHLSYICFQPIHMHGSMERVPIIQKSSSPGNGHLQIWCPPCHSYLLSWPTHLNALRADKLR